MIDEDSTGDIPFDFLEVGELRDHDLFLVLAVARQQDNDMVEVPTYEFVMRRVGEEETIGFIKLRVGNTDNIIRYRGHIGYGVEPAFRGQRYAARASRLLLPLAREHGLNPLWITCNPDNTASRRTCELLGARLVEVVEVPRDAPAYWHGARQKCRYRLDL